ncbi:hypothetical protein [Streptomyces mirabilis]|uniref:hypothetical protein n=1 Tax=Streptomyces mirabilis TaxID=68239 RepID=UPI0021C12419|nr:hypothetical protein [Streptomyces mirabilis]MCT9105407.1 hypothetical protein [Streptomyces mirabilis]
MQPFIFKQGQESWESGTLLHWYIAVGWDDPHHDALAQRLAHHVGSHGPASSAK